MTAADTEVLLDHILLVASLCLSHDATVFSKLSSPITRCHAVVDFYPIFHPLAPALLWQKLQAGSEAISKLCFQGMRGA